MTTNKIEDLEAGSYYKINGTKRILYWNGEKWMKPMKDHQKRYGSWVADLDEQPNVKYAELIDVREVR